MLSSRNVSDQIKFSHSLFIAAAKHNNITNKSIDAGSRSSSDIRGQIKSPRAVAKTVEAMLNNSCRAGGSRPCY
jgi:hypothetical protein